MARAARGASSLICAAARLMQLRLTGCGYALSGRGSYLPAHIRIIGVPLFVNNTPVFEIEQKVTAKVQAELTGRGRYEVRPDRQGVDAVLIGEISAVICRAGSVQHQQQATRYAVTLVAKVEFRDLKNNKEIWPNPQIVFTEQYDVTTTQTATDPNAFLGSNVNAMDRLASEFARTVVSAILESF